MKRPCDGPGCATRRRHHDDPYEPRGVQYVDAPDDHPGPYFCSIECQAYWNAEQRRRRDAAIFKNCFEPVPLADAENIPDPDYGL